jgi:hypothetical protein
MSATAETKEPRSVARWSAAGYVSVSLAAAAIFSLAAALAGSYPEVAVIGGAVWVFLLSLIVSMPLMTSFVKRRMAR